MAPTYYRAIPARGTYPGPYHDRDGDFRQHLRYEHDPRGYHPDWQRGWQEGYTHGWKQWCWDPNRVPDDVDKEQWTDGAENGVSVGAYDSHLRLFGSGQPSQWWRDPRSEGRTPDPWYEGIEEREDWTVVITVHGVSAVTPQAAAISVWEAPTREQPSRIEVYPASDPTNAVTIDLNTPSTGAQGSTT